MTQTMQQLIASDVPLLWISARTLGICAWLASSATVIAGLVISTRLFTKGSSTRTMNTIHRAAATLTLFFVIGHILTLVPDPYAKLTLLDAVVPGMAPINTIATALGTIAFLALVLVSLAGIMRQYVGAKTWKAIHSVAFIVWPLASLHFIMMGSEAMANLSLLTVALVAGLLVLLLLRRGFISPRQVRARVDRPAPRQEASTAVRSAQLRVAQVIPETPDATTLVFAVPDHLVAPFAYRPGQHLTLRVPSLETGSVARCYSLSSAPEVEKDLRITVKRSPGGYASNWLCDNAFAGMQLEVLRPSGTFTPTNNIGDLVLFAGGSGIAPMMSMIKSALATRSRRITLVYANRDEESVIFGKELAELRKSNPELLSVQHWLQSIAGMLTAEDVQDILGQHLNRDVFICGPAPFMTLVSGAAAAIGVPESRIHIEEFRSLTGDPFSPRVPSVFSSSSASGDDSRAGATALQTRTSVAHVRLKNRTHVVEWPQESSLVDALLDAGVDAPYSCLEGACGACKCELVSGSVSSSLASTSHEPGERVLGCQVRPNTEAVEVKFH